MHFVFSLSVFICLSGNFIHLKDVHFSLREASGYMTVDGACLKGTIYILEMPIEGNVVDVVVGEDVYLKLIEEKGKLVSAVIKRIASASGFELIEICIGKKVLFSNSKRKG